jgi:hypothetical protein
MTFIPDTSFNSSHKMGDASISLTRALEKFPNPNDSESDGKCEYSWSGSFIASDGTKIRASFWDWKGGLRAGCGVSIWVDDSKYLDEFRKFIQA